MKTVKKVIYEGAHDVVTHITCDFCKETRDGDSWENGCYDTKETSIYFKSGANYPDDCYGEMISFDICPKCFMDKLVPWAKSIGAEPLTKQYGHY